MLTVDEYDLIRRKHLVDEMSQRAISRELGYARNTVAKATPTRFRRIIDCRSHGPDRPSTR